MTSFEKIKLAREHLKALGLSSRAGAPPIVRALWLFRIPVPPFFFWRFSSVALFTGTFFGVCVGVLLALWTGKGTSPWIMFGVPALIGAAFGFSNARRCQAVARKYHLPLWSQYSPEHSTRPATRAPMQESEPNSNSFVAQSWSTKSVKCRTAAGQCRYGYSHSCHGCSAPTLLALAVTSAARYGSQRACSRMPVALSPAWLC